MSDEERPSEYCKRMQEEALERGETDTALAYFEMYNFWKEKGM